MHYAAAILRGDEIQLFDWHVSRNVNSYANFASAISEGFNNRAMQEGFNTYLQSPRFDQFGTHSTTPNDDLITLVSVKINYSKNPASWKFEDNVLEILETLVSGKASARSPIDHLHVDRKGFQEFNSALANSLQKNLKEGRSVNGVSASLKPEM